MSRRKALHTRNDYLVLNQLRVQTLEHVVHGRGNDLGRGLRLWRNLCPLFVALLIHLHELLGAGQVLDHPLRYDVVHLGGVVRRHGHGLREHRDVLQRPRSRLIQCVGMPGLLPEPGESVDDRRSRTGQVLVGELLGTFAEVGRQRAGGLGVER